MDSHDYNVFTGVKIEIFFMLFGKLLQTTDPPSIGALRGLEERNA